MGASGGSQDFWEGAQPGASCMVALGGREGFWENAQLGASCMMVLGGNLGLWEGAQPETGQLGRVGVPIF